MMANTSRIVRRDELPNPRVLRGAIRLAGDLPNDAYISGVPKFIHRNVAVTNGGAAGVTVMHTFTLPANSLKSDGDYISGIVSGTFDNNNDTDKGFQLFFGGQAIGGSGNLDIDGNNSGWTQYFEIHRLTATTVIVPSLMLWNAVSNDSANNVNTLGTGFVGQGRCITLTGGTAIANLNSNNTVLECKGNGGMAANDIVQRYTRLELVRQ
jgi:hypothetical protein